MPLTNHFNSANNCKLAVWKITETEQYLRERLALTSAQVKALEERKTLSGRQGYLAVRTALASLEIPLDQLSISSQGIPLLPSSYCSLSHTQKYAAAVVSPTSVGIDIESYRPKIHRIADKFVHQNEQAFLGEEVTKLTRLWTAKEAIYKALKVTGLSLRQQIELMPFDLEDTSGSAKVHLPDHPCTVQLQFSTFEEHELTIAHNILYERID